MQKSKHNRKLKRHLTVQSLVSVNYALVHPYLTYGCILWGNNYEAPLSQLVKLQNKAITIINNVPIRDHVNPHYVSLGLIKLPDIIKLSTCQLFYDHIVDKKTSNFAFSFAFEIHDYASRSTSLQHLNLTPFRINIRKFFTTIIGCCYWNNIPISIQEKPTKKLFKRALFSHYFSQYQLMSSSDHVLFTYLLFKMWFLFPLVFVSYICILYFCTASFYCMKKCNLR